MLMKNNERLLVCYADPYSNMCSRKLTVKPLNTTLPSVPKVMNGAWYGPTELGFLLPTTANDNQLENYPISFQEHPELNRDIDMLRLLDGNESFAGAEGKLRAFCEHQAWSLELPRQVRSSTSDAKESSETTQSSMTRKRTLVTAFGGSAEAFASAVAAIAKDYMERPCRPRQFRPKHWNTWSGQIVHQRQDKRYPGDLVASSMSTSPMSAIGFG